MMRTTLDLIAGRAINTSARDRFALDLLTSDAAHLEPLPGSPKAASAPSGGSEAGAAAQRGGQFL